MKRFALLALLLCSLAAHAADQKSADGWIPLFNGKNLDGWKASENPDSFRVDGGKIVVKGPRSHLFYVGPVEKANFKNFEFKADVLTKPNSNSGVYFHTEYQESGWPARGYEVQVNNTHRDPKKTAGLYGIKDNLEAPAKDDEWFTLSIRVEGKRVVTKVNGKTIIDFTEESNPERKGMFTQRVISNGTFALQGHDPLSEVHFKNIQVKPLP
jgi:hypothetical protein